VADEKSRLRRTARAENDLLKIWLYIGRHNPQAADRLLDILNEKSEALAQNPYLGMARRDIAEDIRHFPVGNYLILYRAVPDGVRLSGTSTAGVGSGT
jgi:toxin ParE1/3/4